MHRPNYFQTFVGVNVTARAGVLGADDDFFEKHRLWISPAVVIYRRPAVTSLPGLPFNMTDQADRAININNPRLTGRSGPLRESLIGVKCNVCRCPRSGSGFSSHRTRNRTTRADEVMQNAVSLQTNSATFRKNRPDDVISTHRVVVKPWSNARIRSGAMKKERQRRKNAYETSLATIG